MRPSREPPRDEAVDHEGDDRADDEQMNMTVLLSRP
jgi:hypothetical protein